MLGAAYIWGSVDGDWPDWDLTWETWIFCQRIAGRIFDFQEDFEAVRGTLKLPGKQNLNTSSQKNSFVGN